MKKIALLSDSHGYLDEAIIQHLVDSDEIWHAGDVGSAKLLDRLPENKTKRIVSGNIDDQDIRSICPEELVFEVEGMKIMMIHIGGKPPRYAKGIKEKILREQAEIFVCGHSHICQVEFDPKLHCLYMNPGAVGRHGFHQVRTLLKFEITEGQAKNLRVVELGPRAK
ncbi:metallophosphoesterase family protein [Pararhodonellum marinum]|uniref:metallophosphoesterase family protein n=1 Tax=Pararhodonellum marinum TaxID=2755358 RepID=UPI00188DFBA8|nr:metallophosphoesterase family protein [Pararhodonellum marinum]